jgi:vacuolar-type H+-ATPase subunit I/STV1
VIRLGRCFCPNCGKEHSSAGPFGTSLQCSCGAWVPQTTLDRVRHYWIVQIALSFGVATFFFALALFFRDLPNDPWKRFLSPMLQGPVVTVFMVSYLILIRHKKRYDGDDLMFRYFFWGVSLMSLGIVAALLEATLEKL